MIPLGVLASARVASGGGVAYQYVGVTNDLANVPIGTAAANRIVIAVLMAETYGANPTATATIGGVTATVDYNAHRAYDEVAYWRHTVFAHATVPTGTTAVVDFAGTGIVTRGKAVAVWTVNATSATFTAGTGYADVNTTPTVLSLTAPTGALVLATANTGLDYFASTTWAGDLAEDFDALTAGAVLSGASAAPAAGAVSATVTLGGSYADDRVDMVAYQIGA